MAKMAKDSEVPGTILPAQYFTPTALAATPEKRLLLAVLMDAVGQLRSGDAHGALDAERWIRGELADVPISFSDACDALGLEADRLADGLMSCRARSHFVPRVRHRVAQLGRLHAHGRDRTPAAPTRKTAS